jgi:hypothetical protein
MALTRPLLLAVACVLPLSAVACGGGDDDPITQPTPEGTHYGYVVSKAFVPASNDQARMYGLDLGGPKTGTPDGTVDNRLGEVLGTLAGLNFDIQGTIDQAINEGSIILLVDFQTADFASAKASGLSVKIGANPMPAPCTSTTDTVCGHHLTGTGSFSIATDSPTDTLVSGKIVNGTFNGGPGNLSLQIALGTTQPLTLSLLDARAKATGISDSGMTVTVGGALSNNDLTTQVLPAIQGQIAGVLDGDCDPAGSRQPPSCGCKKSTTTQILNLFDGDLGTAKDCKITVEEIAGHPLIKSLLAPDICGSKSCSASDSLSIGLQVQVVKATFPM